MKKEKEEKRIISLQLPCSLIKQLENKAEESDNTVSRIIRIAIKQYLERED